MTAADRDRSLRIFGHVDLNAGGFGPSVRFDETVLAGSARLPNLNVVDRQPRCEPGTVGHGAGPRLH